MKVLHLLESSIPHTTGYTVRARAIVDYQRRLGIEPIVVTSPLFPARDSAVTLEHYDGVRYYRTNHIPAPASASSKLASYGVRAMMLARYRRAVMDIAMRERPDVLHAHSSYTNAYAAFPTARRLGLPVVYEVRTLWGESAVVEDGWRPDSWKHKLIWRFELGAMRRADLVVPISRGIRDELVERGIRAEKLEIVPNGVDSSRFTPTPRDDGRAEIAGLATHFVVGFVGSIRRLEGLSTLIEAYGICRSRGRRVGLVIVGEGPDKKALEAQALKLGQTDIVFTGEVAHSEVASWYSIMDVLAYPRIRAVITERVTPLKPLEAMALGKVCIGSDVGGLTELIINGTTGIIFPSGNAEALAATLMGLMDDQPRMEQLRSRALEYVRTERDWGNIVPRYVELYERLVHSKRGRSAT
jgi:PEP-CTERM/exosortase A-associated glycosyltransferase